MINVFQSLIEYKENEWEEYLDRILLLNVFKDVIEAYPDKDTLKCVIRYIAYAYSVQSDKIILGQDWEDNKKQIFEFVCVKPTRDLEDQLVFLLHPSITKSIHKYLDFQENSTHKTLSSLKDLKIEMQLSCNSRILKATGEIDFDQKFKNAGYVRELGKMIDDLEKELIQNDPRLKEAAKEVYQKSKEKNSRSVGSYAL